MRIAVTGGSGFVGGHLLRAAAAAGHQVVALVRSEASAARVREAGAQAVLSALEASSLAAALEGADALVHLAHIGAEKEGQTYQAVNVEGTRAAVQAAAAAGVRRVLMFSGLGVARYGQQPRVTSRYFRSKLEAESALFTAGVEAVAFRPSYVLGPGEGFVPWLLRQARSGVLELPGDASYRMQPVAVEDAAEAILAAADPAHSRLFYGARPPHRVFDLVGPEPLPVAEFVRRLFETAAALGHPFRFQLRAVPTTEADGAARSTGWHGLAADELDCLLCDEVADHLPLQELLRRPLRSLPQVLRRTVEPLLVPQ